MKSCILVAIALLTLPTILRGQSTELIIVKDGHLSPDTAGFSVTLPSMFDSVMHNVWLLNAPELSDSTYPGGGVLRRSSHVYFGGKHLSYVYQEIAGVLIGYLRYDFSGLRKWDTAEFIRRELRFIRKHINNLLDTNATRIAMGNGRWRISSRYVAEYEPDTMPTRGEPQFERSTYGQMDVIFDRDRFYIVSYYFYRRPAPKAYNVNPLESEEVKRMFETFKLTGNGAKGGRKR